MSDPNPQGRGGLERDEVYARPRQDLVEFSFDEEVARVFPDMIRRSVPGYETLNGLLGVLAERYVLAGTNIY
ncbi:MAG: carboxy-S-adenosyl-L-methionine synthase CmoA, partial [Gammaproteobacteria bacterium]|nr:carboxy-S-adenosyl-L-methionine synthase CmoA [Gammaproteobacteria bacterium]